MDIMNLAQEYIYYIIGGLVLLLLMVMLCKDEDFVSKEALEFIGVAVMSIGGFVLFYLFVWKYVISY
jgi:hypothetical protein